MYQVNPEIYSRPLFFSFLSFQGQSLVSCSPKKSTTQSGYGGQNKLLFKEKLLSLTQSKLKEHIVSGITPEKRL